MDWFLYDRDLRYERVNYFSKIFIIHLRQSPKYVSGLLKEDACWRNHVVNIAFVIFNCFVSIQSLQNKSRPVYCYSTHENKMFGSTMLDTLPDEIILLVYMTTFGGLKISELITLLCVIVKGGGGIQIANFWKKSESSFKYYKRMT